MSTISTIDAARANKLEKLLAACAAGDEAAFASLYEMTSPQLFAVVLRILNSRAVAQEALQDTYLKVWQKAGDYRPAKARPMTWLIAIARHRAIDLIRRDKGELSLDDEAAAEPVENDPGPAQQASLSEDMQALESCLAELNPDQQRSIRLVYLHGLKYQEVAKRLGTPLNTVKSWVRRGTLSLKECMGM